MNQNFLAFFVFQNVWMFAIEEQERKYTQKKIGAVRNPKNDRKGFDEVFET